MNRPAPADPAARLLHAIAAARLLHAVAGARLPWCGARTAAALAQRGARAVAAALLLACLAPGAAVASNEPGHEGEDHSVIATFTVSDFEAQGVKLATAAAGDVDAGVELPGEVRANADRIAHLAPRFAGIAREVRRRIGDSVRAGDVLAVIESENLAPYELRTAIDGVVIDRHVAPGEAVGPDEAAFIVADLSSVWVDLAVYQGALPFVHAGQTVSLVASRGALRADAKVSYVAPVVDQATRTAVARAELANPEGAWRPGLYVTAFVSDPIPVGVVVEQDALQYLGGRPVVFVAEGGHFRAREVVPGRKGRTMLEIAGGLAPGERYANVRSFLLKAEIAKGEGGHGDDE